MKKIAITVFIICTILSTPALSEKIRILYDDITNSYNKDEERVEQTSDDSDSKNDNSSDHSDENTSDNSEEHSTEHKE